MPADDVSDLKDVFDAIDRLCETMRTSNYEDAEIFEDTSICEVAEPRYVECGAELASPGEVAVRTVDALRAERWTEAPASPPDREDAETIPSDTEAANAASEYYTASSEVSLLSDEAADRHSEEEARPERKECVIAGHVAAMRERFESMTRSGTPCPDAASDASAAVTPSPDRLG